MVPPKRGLSESSLTSVADMIDDVFGNDTDNIVDFGFLHAILLILTRRLCLLDRKVAVNIKHAPTHQNFDQNSNKIAVGEIKITTESEKKAGQEKRAQFADEIQNEKILLVERRASTVNATTSLGADYALDQRPQSLVTREQYISLEDDVKELQKRFGYTGSELMESFYQTTSFSDPMAVLQLSARLEAIERAINDMMEALMKFPLVANEFPAFAKILPFPGYNIPEEAMNTKGEAEYGRVPLPRESSFKSMYSRDSKDSKTSKLSSRKKTDASVSELGSESNNLDENVARPPTMEEFRCIIKRFSDDMAKLMQKKCNPISQKSTSAKQNIVIHSDRLTIILDNESTIYQLENKVKQFVDGAAKLEYRFNKKTTRIYEMLTKMQTQVDIALENMNEALAKPFPENEAIPELARNMDALLLDINGTSDIQDELDDQQETLERSLKVFEKQIYDLELVKANRDELDEALECKIDLSTINGFMTMEYYNAVLGKLQSHINDLFHYFNSREAAWQKRIDFYLSPLEGKANKSDVIAFKDDIIKNFTKLEDHLDFMISICAKNGIQTREHREVILNRQCISCDRRPDEKFKSKTSKKRKQHTDDNDENKICHLNNPIPHPIHPGSKCVKFCVGPNKLIDNKIEKISEELASTIIVQSSKRSDMQTVTNEKMSPCEPCNTPEWKNIILKHNLKVIQKPKTELLVPKKMSIAQEDEKSKDSIISIRRRRSKPDASRKSININYSRPHLNDSDSQNSEERTLLILDLDEEFSLLRY